MIIVLHQETLDGKRIVFHSDTEFLIQSGKGAKGGYKTRVVIKGSLARAVMHYNLLNIGNGYKKRLVMLGSTRKPILSSQLTFGFMPKAIRQVKTTILAQASS